MIPEAPIVRWNGVALVDQDGEDHTRAQDAKAQRYVKLGLVRHTGTTHDSKGYGLPELETSTYELDPIAGCRQLRHVTVKTWRDGAGRITSIDYACDCQKARGGRSSDPGSCSHALAVHLHRKATIDLEQPCQHGHQLADCADCLHTEQDAGGRIQGAA